MQAQFGDGSPEEANPCSAIDNTLVINKRPMFGAYTREAEVARKTSVYREPDTVDKIKQHLINY